MSHDCRWINKILLTREASKCLKREYLLVSSDCRRVRMIYWIISGFLFCDFFQPLSCKLINHLGLWIQPAIVVLGYWSIWFTIRSQYQLCVGIWKTIMYSIDLIGQVLLKKMLPERSIGIEMLKRSAVVKCPSCKLYVQAKPGIPCTSVKLRDVQFH